MHVSMKILRHLLRKRGWRGMQRFYQGSIVQQVNIQPNMFSRPSAHTPYKFGLNIFFHKLWVYGGKTENHRGMTSLCNFSRLAEKIARMQRGPSEMIRGSTDINWVFDKRVSGRINAVYDKPPPLKLDWRNVRHLFCTIMDPPMIVRMYKYE